MSRTVSTATLAAAIASQGESLVSIVGLLTTLVGQQSAVHATPAPVAAVLAPPARTVKAVQVKAPKVAKVADPNKAAAWALVKADRVALSPLNKAFAKAGVTGEAWTSRWSNIEAVKAAFATLSTTEQEAAIEAVNRKLAKS